ncbi:MAG: serine O-acetyltransferase [Candidatus Binatota bacterium]|jgi:serine O-acetyltransferase|nr:serine O-acetyltransferase [Candidatus Binatota bacterium]
MEPPIPIDGRTAPPAEPRAWSRIREDVQTIFERDPAARSSWEVVLTYPGFHVLLVYRAAHTLWQAGWRIPARLLSHVGRFLTGIEIHPGAKIGRRFFIDHGMGVVIGETAEVGNDVTIYQGVTLGGTSTHRGKRHPTLEDWVVAGTGAKVLGPITVGRHSRIGAGSVVVSDVPPHATVVGVPGKIVRTEGKHAEGGRPIVDLDHADMPDPVARALTVLLEHVERLERQVGQLSERQGDLERRKDEQDDDLERARKALGG